MSPTKTIPFRNTTDDEAVSPVVGTILMVAVTVALGATVLAIMNGLGDEGIESTSNAVFKATAVDTSGDGKTDIIKLTFVSGPASLSATDVIVNTNAVCGTGESLSKTGTDTWEPGDFTTCNAAAGNWLLTVSVVGSTVLDQTVSVDS